MPPTSANAASERVDRPTGRSLQCGLPLWESQRRPKHPTLEWGDARSNTQRRFECPAKQSVVGHNDVPEPCGSSYGRKTIIEHCLLISAYRHCGSADSSIRFDQFTTKQARVLTASHYGQRSYEFHLAPPCCSNMFAVSRAECCQDRPCGIFA